MPRLAVVALALARAVVPRYHWYVKGAVPEATTKKFAGRPAVTMALTGWVAMVGATGAGFTVRMAALLTASPPALCTLQV